MNVGYRFVVDFARPSKTNSIIISEGDVNSRSCRFTLLFDKQPFSMADVTVATVRAVKQSGSVIYGDATIITDESDNKINEVEYTIPGEMADEAGKVTMTITLMSATGEQITSFEFYLTVRNALYNEDDYVSEEDLSGFRDLLNRAMSALQKMETMTSQDALPNPYALNVLVDSLEYAYNGSEEVNVDFGKVVHLKDEEEEVEDSIDESAASKASASARQAEASALDAMRSASLADEIVSCVLESEGKAEDYASLAYGYKGQAEASASLAQSVTSRFENDIANIKQAIRDLGGVINE